MPYVFISLGIFLVFALLLLWLTGGTLRRLLGYFVEELDENRIPLYPVRLSLPVIKTSSVSSVSQEPPQPPLRKAKPKQQLTSEQNAEHTVLAILTHKIDERKRVVDSTGHASLSNEFFELVFETHDGESLHLTASRTDFKETPFNQDGWLTYRENQFVNFHYSHLTVRHAAPEK